MHAIFAAMLLSHWLVASDLHVEPYDASPLPATYGSDTNWALFDSSVAAMRQADPNPQVVVLAGDLLAHHFPSNVPLALRTMARVARTFDAAFPHAQFVIVPGNNDDPCGDYRATPASAYFAQLARIWAPLVDRGGAAPEFAGDFARYGRYIARLRGGLRAIAIDSVSWSVIYRSCGPYASSSPQLDWFARALAALPPGGHAVVVMHIPPGIDAQSTLLAHRFLIVPFLNGALERRFDALLLRNGNRIAFAVAGHEHREDFRLDGGVPILVAPAISAVYRNNPAFLRLDVAPDGTLVDYQTFAYDEPSGAWHKDHDFDRVFGVGSFTARSLLGIHRHLANDAQLRSAWAAVLVSGSRYRAFSAGAWRAYWCAQTILDGGYAACVGAQRRVIVFAVVFVAVAAGVLALVVWLWYSGVARWRRNTNNRA